jgi:hypothetical protein
VYVAVGAAAAATAIQVARCAGNPAVADWGSLVQTITILGRYDREITLTQVFDDGDTVQLAVRAVTAAGFGGAAAILNPVTIDSTAPAEVPWAAAAVD